MKSILRRAVELTRIHTLVAVQRSTSILRRHLPTEELKPGIDPDASSPPDHSFVACFGLAQRKLAFAEWDQHSFEN